MKAPQEIYRVRRQYNQWVNNQTLEDFALRFTAKAARRWSLSRVASTALGAVSFLALEAIGAAMTLNYGFENSVAAVFVVGFIIFFAGLPICYYASKYGVDIDLLTRGAGFGYIGSTITSLIYASFTFIFFAIEAAIMARALELMLGIPMALGYILCALIVIPLVFNGIRFISGFQVWTQPLWLTLQLIPFIYVLFNDSSLINDWTNFRGLKQTTDAAGMNIGGVNLLLFGGAASVMFALMAQIGEQVDFLRFLPVKTANNPVRWWCALIVAGPGWILIGCIKILIGSFLAVAAIHYAHSWSSAGDPTTLYIVAFGFFTKNSHLALIMAGIFVVISQLKINVTNAYAGSIAWSNFFSRLTHSHPGRVVWLIFNVAIALLLMELGIYHAFESTLSAYALLAVSWVGALVADLAVNKPLGLSPLHIEFKRAHLYSFNPVGIGAMAAGSIIGIFSYVGALGVYAQAMSHFIALATAFVLAPLIAWLTKGKYYIARAPYIFTDKVQTVECSICQNNYEYEDMAHCPAYEGFICSLCCTLDARCDDACKPNAKLAPAVLAFARRILPAFAAHYVNPGVLHFLSLLGVIASVIGLLFALIYANVITSDAAANALVAATLWNVFFVLIIVAGVICWLFLLAHQSRIFAQEESHTQTRRLVQEIQAHQNTDQKLQQAKEKAEAANNAKSRYLTGISHELRSPLNTVLGYAQLMARDFTINEPTREKIAVIKRSGEHLADLIEGLLDISKIEAGRLDIQRNPLRFQSLIEQIVQMFRIEADEKGLQFSYDCLTPLPDAVMGDEKRLRQILINLLSNAIKYTEKGAVNLSVRYRNQVAEFKVSDTGIGIHETEFERIFRPFERVRRPGSPAVNGTGLGLTITRLLTEIMGGEIIVESNRQQGSVFTVSLMLTSIEFPLNEKIRHKTIIGYQGDSRSVMVVDDDATHRGLISDFLSPLLFRVVEAHDADSCLQMLSEFTPDIFLIDRKMPGMDGPLLAKTLRQRSVNAPILMVTANANEDTLSDEELGRQYGIKHEEAYNDYLIKPIRLDTLLQRLAKYLALQWTYSTEPAHPQPQPRASQPEIEHINSGKIKRTVDAKLREKIIRAAEIGHIRQLKLFAAQLREDTKLDPQFILQFESYIQQIRFHKIIELLAE